MEEGIVAGGGTAYVNAISAVEALLSDAEGDEKTGISIIAKALTAPVRQIAANAGHDDAILCRKGGNFEQMKTKHGIYYISGNHDKGYYGAAHRGFSEDDLMGELKKNGINILQDESMLPQFTRWL